MVPGASEGRGSPRISDRWPSSAVLQQAEVRISMDGRCRWMDNVFIERLWHSLKCECVYLNAVETSQAVELSDGWGPPQFWRPGEDPFGQISAQGPSTQSVQSVVGAD